MTADTQNSAVPGPEPAPEMSAAENDAKGMKRAEIRQLARLSPLRSAFELAATWGQIVIAIALCLHFPSPLAYLATFVFVGARQYALLILLHDASHTLLHPRRKINDFIGLWLIAAPCGSTFVNSRASHLKHHRHLGNRDNDPDFFLYCAGLPAKKDSVKAFFWHFTKLVAGGQIIHTLFSMQESKTGRENGSMLSTLRSFLPVVAMQAIILACFAVTGNLHAYFLLWLLPLLTLAVLFNGLRVFCDHAAVNHRDGPASELMVTYFSNPIERFFLSPFDMNYHAEHHFFPYVPHYNLSRLRELIAQNPEYRGRIQWRRSYTQFIVQYLLRFGKTAEDSAVNSKTA